MSLPGLKCTILVYNYCRPAPRWTTITWMLRPSLCHHNSHQTREQHQQSSGNQLRLNDNVLSTKLVNTLNQNVSWFNQNYDRIFGIAEIRDIQNRVLEAESVFVDITQKRKSCQEKIENLKETIKNIRDKLEITPRQSDNYLRLITEEHKLLREQLGIDLELSQYKEREQLSLDNLSKLLRQSHELERLRQERSKYWQIISISLSLAASLVALFAQKARNQRSVTNRLDLIDHRLSDLAQTKEMLENNLVSRIDSLQTSLDHLGRSIDQLTLIDKIDKHEEEVNRKKCSGSSWMSWIPGLTTVWSWSSSILVG